MRRRRRVPLPPVASRHGASRLLSGRRPRRQRRGSRRRLAPRHLPTLRVGAPLAPSRTHWKRSEPACARRSGRRKNGSAARRPAGRRPAVERQAVVAAPNRAPAPSTRPGAAPASRVGGASCRVRRAASATRAPGQPKRWVVGRAPAPTSPRPAPSDPLAAPVGKSPSRLPSRWSGAAVTSRPRAVNARPLPALPGARRRTMR